MSTSLFLWFIPSLHAADCATRTTAIEVVEAANAVENAFIQLDSVGVEASARKMHETVTCLREILPTSDAATVLRTDALARFLAHSTDKVMADYRGASVLQPAYALPMSVAPEGHPLRAYYQAASSLGPGEETPFPEGLSSFVDGRRAAGRPRDRAVIVQFIEPQGAVYSTWFLMPGDALEPIIPWSLIPQRNARTIEQAPRKEHKVAAPLLVTSGVSALLAAGAYGLATSSLSHFEDPSVQSEQRLQELRTATNVEVALSGVFGLTSLGLGTAAFLTISW